MHPVAAPPNVNKKDVMCEASIFPHEDVAIIANVCRHLTASPRPVKLSARPLSWQTLRGQQQGVNRASIVNHRAVNTKQTDGC